MFIMRTTLGNHVFSMNEGSFPIYMAWHTDNQVKAFS